MATPCSPSASHESWLCNPSHGCDSVERNMWQLCWSHSWWLKKHTRHKTCTFIYEDDSWEDSYLNIIFLYCFIEPCVFLSELEPCCFGLSAATSSQNVITTRHNCFSWSHIKCQNVRGVKFLWFNIHTLEKLIFCLRDSDVCILAVMITQGYRRHRQDLSFSHVVLL